MAKRNSIKPEYFYVLYELLFEKCFGDQVEEIAGLPDYKVFGYNKALKEESLYSESIKGIIENANPAWSIDSRALSEAAKLYPERIKPLSDGLIKNCLNFLGFSSLEKMFEQYCSDNNLMSFKAPAYLKYAPSAKRTKSMGTKARIDEKLENLENSTWYCYSHFPFHEQAGEYVPAVMRLVLNITIRLPNGDYQIELINEEPFTSFSGRIYRNFSGDNVLVCEMTSMKKSVGKRFYLAIHVDLDASKDLFVGGFLRYKDSGAVYCGTFVMEKMLAQDEVDPVPKMFYYDGTSFYKVKQVIMDYLYDRHLNIIKIPPNIYSAVDFEEWMRKKKEVYGQTPPEYDLFIAAPIRGYANVENKAVNLRNDLLYEIEAFFPKDKNYQKELLLVKIESVLQKYLTDSSLDEDESKFENVRKSILRMISGLQERAIGLDRIWYAPSNEDFNLHNKIDASTLLSRQLARFNSSRSFMLILPYPVVSSVFLETGWAMLTQRNIPVFIICRRRQDLPFLLRKADTLKNRRIFITTFEEIGGIEGIPDWIVDNQYYKYLEFIR